MAAVLERANARLPINEPDYILQTLLQGYTGQACGKSCAAGQSLSDTGSCVPSTSVARVNTEPTSTPRPKATKTVAARSKPAPASRVAQAKPKPAPRSDGETKISSPRQKSASPGAVAAAKPLAKREPGVTITTDALQRSATKSSGPARRQSFGASYFAQIQNDRR